MPRWLPIALILLVLLGVAAYGLFGRVSNRVGNPPTCNSD